MRLGFRQSAGGPPASGYAVGTTLVIGALALTLAALLIPVDSFGNTASANATAGGSRAFEDDGEGIETTEYGPLSALDRDFVRKVRLAGLWELPAGRQAQERGMRESIRTAGDHLVEGHTELDKLAIEAGRALQIDLANQPTEQQQQWLAQMDAAEGTEYETLFANLLRRAHGKVFGLIGQVRAETRNTLVRDLATRANAVVLDHITVLEATGLVDFDSLTSDAPPPVTPPANGGTAPAPALTSTATSQSPNPLGEVK